MGEKVVIDGVVRAAGGIVTRTNGSDLEVVVIHRPRRSDWSFPKGHLDPGETDLVAARREVGEETGLDVRPVRELGEVNYEVDGRPKGVRFWEFRAVDVDAPFAPDDEVDDARWVNVRTAHDLLTHASDRDLLGKVAHE